MIDLPTSRTAQPGSRTGAVLVTPASGDALHAALADSGREAVLFPLEGTQGVAGVETIEVALLSMDVFRAGRAEEFMATLFAARGLRWLHTLSAGVDHPAFGALRERGVRLTTSAGVAAVPVAHSAVAFVLALARGAAAWMDAQRRAAWEPHEVVDLEGLHAAVLGYGPIGAEIARVLDALRLRVTVVRRGATGEEPWPVRALAELDELLPSCDVVVSALPLTAQTREVLDRRRLKLLPPGAMVVNVSRGGIVDEEALADLVESGHLRGAGLDVFVQEPLPPGHRLWRVPGVLITPHAGGHFPGFDERVRQLFAENLARYDQGLPLHNEAL